MKLIVTIFLFLFPLIINAQFDNRVVASVNKEAISFRKVKIDIVLEGLIFGSETSRIDTLEVQTEKFQTELNRFLLERVVYLESQSFSIAQVTQKEIDGVYSKVISKINSNSVLKKDWASMHVEPSEIKDIIRQKLASQKFVEFKSKSSMLPITDSEAHHHYEINKARYSGKAFKDIKENIKKQLSQEQSEARLNDWYDLLKKKYDVSKVF